MSYKSCHVLSVVSSSACFQATLNGGGVWVCDRLLFDKLLYKVQQETMFIDVECLPNFCSSCCVTKTPSEKKYLIFECLILTNHFSLGAADVLLTVFCLGERRAPTLNSDMQNRNNCLWNLWTWKPVCPSPLLISLTTWHVCKPWSEVQDDVCVWCVRLFIQEVATSSEWQQNQFHSCNESISVVK